MAANPAATLAIGAGLAWHLLRDPPSRPRSSVLACLASGGRCRQGRSTVTMSRPLKRAWASRSGDFAGRVGEQTARMAGTLKESVSDIAEAATQKAKDLGAEASDELAARAASLSRRTAAAVDDASRSMQAMPSTVSNAVADLDTRDLLLLGAAGLAVAAALGIAYQRRGSESAHR